MEDHMTLNPDASSLPWRSPMLHTLAEHWWLLLLRGIAAIVFGLLTFAWPGLTLLTLVIIYGAYALVDGVLALVAAFTGGAKPIPTWWLVIIGLLGIGAGAITFLYPVVTALVLVVFIGVWSIAHGIFEIVGAIQLRKEIDNEWMLILAGAMSVLFGVVILMWPGAGALALVWLIGAYAIVFGALLVGFALRLRRHRGPAPAQHADRTRPISNPPRVN
jgi:uncharacterized membrane protein HdeD (DUF308 family)